MEWASIAFLALIIVLGGLIAFIVWRKVCHKAQVEWRDDGRGFAACLFLSYTLILNSSMAVTEDASSSKSNDHVLVMESQVIPYYNTVLGFFYRAKIPN
ncbi:DUF3413 domain-containing protein [Coxiella endosymbiont of Ornithodoros amblus]|uniref:DUF3413 domain-containing protein n=1 Tax=Coxiella endosymbiont of Ornithodoros amblus TaxID=1656166 RepID=UPI00244E1F34|nr:DUF3413 domain-containing protein [Coxiella endosymbiont of Ornithodoros amblus]